jgi:hypothetical protein
MQVCGVDVPPEDRDFVRLYPELDPMLVSRQGATPVTITFVTRISAILNQADWSSF